MAPRNDGRPIFLELADTISHDVLAGHYPPGSQVPSTTELSMHYRINPATANKALNVLVDNGVLEKRRGIGMFVTDGAPEALKARRRADFHADFITPFLAEGARLGLSLDDIIDLLKEERS